jgi:hypothetical protein
MSEKLRRPSNLSDEQDAVVRADIPANAMVVSVENHVEDLKTPSMALAK